MSIRHKWGSGDIVAWIDPNGEKRSGRLFGATGRYALVDPDTASKEAGCKTGCIGQGKIKLVKAARRHPDCKCKHCNRKAKAKAVASE